MSVLGVFAGVGGVLASPLLGAFVLTVGTVSAIDEVTRNRNDLIRHLGSLETSLSLLQVIPTSLFDIPDANINSHLVGLSTFWERLTQEWVRDQSPAEIEGWMEEVQAYVRVLIGLLEHFLLEPSPGPDGISASDRLQIQQYNDDLHLLDDLLQLIIETCRFRFFGPFWRINVMWTEGSDD